MCEIFWIERGQAAGQGDRRAEAGGRAATAVRGGTHREQLDRIQTSMKCILGVVFHQVLKSKGGSGCWSAAWHAVPVFLTMHGGSVLEEPVGLARHSASRFWERPVSLVLHPKRPHTQQAQRATLAPGVTEVRLLPQDAG